MKKPHEFLNAIRNGQEIEWDDFLQVMGKHAVLPSTICRIFSQTSPFAKKTTIHIEDENGCESLETRFPQPVAVIDRISAAVAGDSHQFAVDGSMLIVQSCTWSHPQVAVSWDGTTWTPLPEADLHLVIVENMQNFLRLRETLSLIKTLCGIEAREDSILFAYGAGNAAAKPCNAQHYRHFASVNCLFDLDRGGIRTYGTLKRLLSPEGMKPTFLIPDDAKKRLNHSRWWLDDDELRYIHTAKNDHPELKPLLDYMHHTRKKLEQETYLETQHG